MSHVVKIERPKKWDDLDNLSEDVAESVRFARDVTIDIIETLEPEHISSFADLIKKLQNALVDAKTQNFLDKLEKLAVEQLATNL